jgi:hypothetical protein
VLKAVLDPLKYQNLDAMPQFKGVNTTTEFLTKHVFDGMAEAARKGGLGRDGRELHAVRVTVAESPSARAWYEAPLWCSRWRLRSPAISTLRPAVTPTTSA